MINLTGSSGQAGGKLEGARGDKPYEAFLNYPVAVIISCQAFSSITLTPNAVAALSF